MTAEQYENARDKIKRYERLTKKIEDIDHTLNNTFSAESLEIARGTGGSIRFTIHTEDSNEDYNLTENYNLTIRLRDLTPAEISGIRNIIANIRSRLAEVRENL